LRPIQNTLIALLIIALLGQSDERGGGLASIEVFNTGPFECNQNLQGVLWRNDAGSKYIRRGELWLGMNAGSRSDLTFVVQRQSDQTNLFRGNWDHYADPTGIGDQMIAADFAPDYIEMARGDTLILYYRCVDLADAPPGAGHIIVTLWYQ